MAVTKIRKFSSSILLGLLVVSIAVCLAFFFLGDVTLDPAGNKVYAYTDYLLYWAYALVVLTLVATAFFAITSLVQGFRTNPKKALRSLLFFVFIIVIMCVAFAMGDSTPLAVNEDSASYNTPFWLKTIDMCIYTCYVLVVLIFVAMIWGSISKKLSK